MLFQTMKYKPATSSIAQTVVDDFIVDRYFKIVINIVNGLLDSN